MLKSVHGAEFDDMPSPSLSYGSSAPACCPKDVGGGLESRGCGLREALGWEEEGHEARTGAGSRASMVWGMTEKKGIRERAKKPSEGDWRLQFWCRMGEKVWWVCGGLRCRMMEGAPCPLLH